MSSFSIDWLNLREAADHRARDRELLERAAHWLNNPPGAIGANLVVDLGAGTGSTLRAFSAITGSTMNWRLIDQDRGLLDEARLRHASQHELEICRTDLAQVAALPLQEARLITASALFDLVSAAFLESLSARLQSMESASPIAVYAALNYNGVTHWEPEHPLDEAVLAAFNRDQKKDKGFGPALGPDAGDRMQQIFRQAGYTVYSADSPWELSGDDSKLLANLIEGIADAVSGDRRISATALQDWTRFRLSHLDDGRCTVGHDDLLAMPEHQIADNQPGH